MASRRNAVRSGATISSASDTPRRCRCYRDVNLVKLIRQGKADKPVSDLRIRHQCGATMQLQRTPPTRQRTRERPSALVLPFEKPKR